jgi:hypothetical protein
MLELSDEQTEAARDDGDGVARRYSDNKALLLHQSSQKKVFEPPRPTCTFRHHIIRYHG